MPSNLRSPRVTGGACECTILYELERKETESICNIIVSMIEETQWNGPVKWTITRYNGLPRTAPTQPAVPDTKGVRRTSVLPCLSTISSYLWADLYAPRRIPLSTTWKASAGTSPACRASTPSCLAMRYAACRVFLYIFVYEPRASSSPCNCSRTFTTSTGFVKKPAPTAARAPIANSTPGLRKRESKS